MLVNNPIHNACNYAVDSEYLSPPDSEQVRRGVVPLDSLPADWWNFFIKDASDGINEAQRAIQDYISEVKTLTTAAKIPENQECKDRIFCAIDVLRQTIATASLAGAVKSSDIKGQVSVNKDTGIMTANGVGNAEFTNMGAISGEGTKSYGTVTEAIRGTREETINVFTTVKGDINALKNGKAPTNHANAEATYGVGTADLYGHLKISDTYDSLVAGTGVAASQKALHCIYTQLQNMGAAPSNKAACAATENGTSGTSPNYSRGDHTHPYPDALALSDLTPVMQLSGGGLQTFSCRAPWGCFYCACAKPISVCITNTMYLMNNLVVHQSRCLRNDAGCTSYASSYKGIIAGYYEPQTITTTGCQSVGIGGPVSTTDVPLGFYDSSASSLSYVKKCIPTGLLLYKK